MLLYLAWCDDRHALAFKTVPKSIARQAASHRAQKRSKSMRLAHIRLRFFLPERHRDVALLCQSVNISSAWKVYERAYCCPYYSGSWECSHIDENDIDIIDVCSFTGNDLYGHIIFYRNKASHLKIVNGRTFFLKRHFVIWNSFYMKP